MWRKIGGGVVGVVVAFLLVQASELIVHHLYPFPPGMDTHDMKAIKAFVGTLPPAAFVLVLSGWLVGTFAGTFAAAWIGRSAVPGYVVGAILLAGGIMNSIVIPQPPWFSIASFFVYIGMTILGSRAGTPAVRSAA